MLKEAAVAECKELFWYLRGGTKENKNILSPVCGYVTNNNGLWTG
jgi:hypothetical protein